MIGDKRKMLALQALHKGKPPKSSKVESFIAIAAAGGLATSAIVTLLDKPSDESPFEEQVTALTEAQATIKALEPFLAEQKRTVEQRQLLLGSLSTEAEKLRKLVAADRAIVDALLSEQQQRYEEQIWIERLWSLGIGVLGGIATHFIIRPFTRRRQRQAEQRAPG